MLLKAKSGLEIDISKLLREDKQNHRVVEGKGNADQTRYSPESKAAFPA